MHRNWSQNIQTQPIYYPPLTQTLKKPTSNINYNNSKPLVSFTYGSSPEHKPKAQHYYVICPKKLEQVKGKNPFSSAYVHNHKKIEEQAPVQNLKLQSQSYDKLSNKTKSKKRKKIFSYDKGKRKSMFAKTQQPKQQQNYDLPVLNLAHTNENYNADNYNYNYDYNYSSNYNSNYHTSNKLKSSYDNFSDQVNPIYRKLNRNASETKSIKKPQSMRRSKIFKNSKERMNMNVYEESDSPTYKQQSYQEPFSSSLNKNNSRQSRQSYEKQYRLDYDNNYNFTKNKPRQNYFHEEKFKKNQSNSFEEVIYNTSKDNFKIRQHKVKSKFSLGTLDEQNILNTEEIEDDQRFFDMDLRISKKKQSVKQINDSFLSPERVSSQIEKPVKSQGFVQKLKNLYKEADNEGKIITMTVITLGVLLVIFQAFLK